jgi:tetratricopeptide (TPR) repeat protein
VDEVLAKSTSLPPRQRALALSAAGFVRFADGDQARARRLLKQSLPSYRRAGDRLGMGLTAAALGHLLAAKYEAPLAIDLLEQTLIQLRKMAGEELTAPERVQHQLDLALASNFLGQIKLDQEDHQRAAELFTEGLTAARSAADRFTILVSLYDLALSRQARGDLSSAADLLRQGLSLAAEAGDEPGLAYYLEALAVVVAQQGQPALAVSLLAAAGALLEANGSGWLHAYVPRGPHGDNARAGLRARMTDAAFQQAWAYGRSLTSISVVRYALEEIMSRPDQAWPPWPVEPLSPHATSKKDTKER